MTDVLLQRNFDPPLTPAEVLAMVSTDDLHCFALHKVAWRMSLLSLSGRQMVCWFNGPDAESVRIALRQAGADIRRLWPGTVHDAPGLDGRACNTANVLVERLFQHPTSLDEIQALEDAGAGCLQMHRVRFARTFASLDGRRMLCLYQAPDAESVRLAQRQAGVPLDRAWSFQQIAPAAK